MSTYNLIIIQNVSIMHNPFTTQKSTNLGNEDFFFFLRKKTRTKAKKHENERYIH